jgi:hypothetical protein
MMRKVKIVREKIMLKREKVMIQLIGSACAPSKKKPGSKEPGLRQWPREADTITFQEDLLSLRVTGGGGQYVTRSSA